MLGPTPTISVVTPSYNQGRFLEDSIRSIVTQHYPEIEYIVMDGGSNDSSMDVIRQYEDRISYWASEPDGGQYDAINKGFAKTSGQIMAWLNSDDKYTPWAFEIVAEVFSIFPQIEWLTSAFPPIWDEFGRAVRCRARRGFSRRGFYRGEHLNSSEWYSKGFIQQESTFWRRSLWDRAGGYLDTSFGLAADFDLWARFYRHAELYEIATPLAGILVHGEQKTAHHLSEYLQEAKQILHRHGGRPYGKFESLIRIKILDNLPGPLKKLSTILHLTSERRICVYSGRPGNWKILTSYI